MGDHDRIVDLSEWKKKKEEEEIEGLRVKVSALIDQYFGEEELTGYYPALDEMVSYTGLYASNTINVEPNAQSCASALAWISYTILGLGMIDEACVLDSLIERIESKL